ncbi:hypothetical protein Tco_1246617 [Tanacetum coccineum]
MASLKYCDKYNQVGFLKKTEESAGFVEIVNFLKGSHIRGVPRPLLPAMLLVVAQNAGQADPAGTQSQPSSSTITPPPIAQPAPPETTTIPPTPITEPTSEPS